MQRNLTNSVSVAHLTLYMVLIGLNANNLIGQDSFQERSVIGDLIRIHGAQATYHATSGNGNYGALNQLLENRLIDSALASGDKYGYWFLLSFTNHDLQNPAKFNILATPQKYGVTGRRSFFIDESGDIRGGDKKGGLATADDPFLDACAVSGISDNERCTIAKLRHVHGAESTYQSTSGQGNYGTLRQLIASNLIPKSFANGTLHGYQLSITLFSVGYESPAHFQVSAVPQKYGITGIRSFFIGTDGVLRGADKKGKPANEKDPAIDNCTPTSIPEIEICIARSLGTLQSAQETYLATYGNGGYGTLMQLYKAGLIPETLADGIDRGYTFKIEIFAPKDDVPARFRMHADPEIYDVSGVRSFYVGPYDMIRAADKNGRSADENDPPFLY